MNNTKELSPEKIAQKNTLSHRLFGLVIAFDILLFIYLIIQIIMLIVF